MRGKSDPQGVMFHSFNLEEMIPQNHPLRAIKPRVDAELWSLRKCFESAYSATGRPSIPPEQLIKASLLQALYSIRSERRLCEQIQYNMLFRWFLDMAPEENAWNHSTFTRNRERFSQNDLMGEFFRSSTMQAVREDAVSHEHFSVDGTLIESWASMKSFRPKDNDDDGGEGPGSNRWVDWHGEKRSNETHASRTDSEARLMRKGAGRESKLSHSMHILMENRNGLIMDVEMDQADGLAERRSALAMLKRGRERGLVGEWATLGADAGYDDGEFLLELERMKVRGHVALKAPPVEIRGAGDLARLDGWEAMRHGRGPISRRARMRVETIFGWLKTIAGWRKAKLVGRWKLTLQAQVAAAAYNFLRLSKLELEPQT